MSVAAKKNNHLWGGVYGNYPPPIEQFDWSACNSGHGTKNSNSTSQMLCWPGDYTTLPVNLCMHATDHLWPCAIIKGNEPTKLGSVSTGQYLRTLLQ